MHKLSAWANEVESVVQNCQRGTLSERCHGRLQSSALPEPGPARPAVQRGEAATLRCVPTRHTAPAVTQPCGGRLWGQRPALPVLPAKAREWATGTFPFPQFELCFHLPSESLRGWFRSQSLSPPPQ